MKLLMNIILLSTNLFIATSILASDKVIDLALDSEQAILRGIPIMLVFIDDDCEDCEKINEEVIRPMQISGEYRDKVIIRIINMQADKVIDFDGTASNVENIANRYDLELTPTVSFVDEEGHEIGPSISGMSNLEYYASLVDESISTSLSKIHERKQD